MTKYRIVDIPDVKPFKCVNCRSSKKDGRRYVDFGEDVEWYGTVFICGFCLKDVSIKMGLFEEVNETLARATVTKNEVSELFEKGEQLHETVVKTFKEFEEFYGTLHSHVQSSVEHSTDSDSNLGNEETATKSGTTETKPRAVKSAPSSGRENVRSLTDLLNKPVD